MKGIFLAVTVTLVYLAGRTAGSVRSLSPLTSNALSSDLRGNFINTREHSLLGGKRQKRDVRQSVQQLQESVNKAKLGCGQHLGFSMEQLQKPLISEENPTAKEKCLMECILKKVKIMGADNKLSIEGVGRIAQAFSENNPLVINIALATATNCNNRLTAAMNPCVAAGHINKCVSQALKAHKLKIVY